MFPKHTSSGYTINKSEKSQSRHKKYLWRVQAEYDGRLIGAMTPRTEKNGQSRDCIIEINKQDLGSHWMNPQDYSRTRCNEEGSPWPPLILFTFWCSLPFVIPPLMWQTWSVQSLEGGRRDGLWLRQDCTRLVPQWLPLGSLPVKKASQGRVSHADHWGPLPTAPSRTEVLANSVGLASLEVTPSHSPEPWWLWSTAQLQPLWEELCSSELFMQPMVHQKLFFQVTSFAVICYIATDKQQICFNSWGTWEPSTCLKTKGRMSL